MPAVETAKRSGRRHGLTRSLARVHALEGERAVGLDVHPFLDPSTHNVSGTAGRRRYCGPKKYRKPIAPSKRNTVGSVICRVGATSTKISAGVPSKM